MDARTIVLGRLLAALSKERAAYDAMQSIRLSTSMERTMQFKEAWEEARNATRAIEAQAIEVLAHTEAGQR